MHSGQGQWATHLKHWLQHLTFAPMFVLLDEYEQDPFGSARNVYVFLGFYMVSEPEKLSELYNQKCANRSCRLLKTKDAFYNLTRTQGGGEIWKAAILFGLRGLYGSVSKDSSKLAIPVQEENTLIKLRVKSFPEVRELSKLIGRPLYSWLRL